METKNNINGVDYDKLRTNIEMLTNARGLFPVDVAASIGLSKHVYRAKRKCPWTFKIDELDKLASLFGVDLPTLMFGSVYLATRHSRQKLNICF